MTGNDNPSTAGGGRGCRRAGCLFGCLLPIVLTLVGIVLVRPVLQERWTGWRAENPWVEQVPAVVSVLREMSGGPGDSAAGGDSTAAARTAPRRGVDQKSALPSDLPVWPTPKSETFSIGDGHAAAYQRVSQTSDTVLRYFRRAMPAQGWRLDAERTGAGGVLLVYRKSDRLARVEVVADSGGTDVWVRSRRGER